MKPVYSPRCRSKIRTLLKYITVVFLFSALPANAENTESVWRKPDWMVISGASRHFRQHDKDWKEFNPGFGFEWESRQYTDINWIGGYYRNSYDRDTFYAGARWMPLAWGPVKFGIYTTALSGYHWPVAVLPAVSVGNDRVGANFVIAPSVGDDSGFIGIQLRIRLK